MVRVAEFRDLTEVVIVVNGIASRPSGNKRGIQRKFRFV